MYKFELMTILVIIFTTFVVIYNKFLGLDLLQFVLQDQRSIDNIHSKIQLESESTDDSGSTHQWNEQIDKDIIVEIDNINNEIITHLPSDMVYVPSMTELYFSSKRNIKYGKHFNETNHIDGPFFSCKTYRALVFINGNKSINTAFHGHRIFNFKKYDVVLFDYNNTKHYVNFNPDVYDDSQRIVLKLHYILKSDFCQHSNCIYARKSRDLYVLNQTKKGISGKIIDISLFYFKNRLNILVLVYFAFVLYIYTGNIIVKILLWIFVLTEILIVMYMFHFTLLKMKECVVHVN